MPSARADAADRSPNSPAKPAPTEALTSGGVGQEHGRGKSLYVVILVLLGLLPLAFFLGRAYQDYTREALIESTREWIRVAGEEDEERSVFASVNWPRLDIYLARSLLREAAEKYPTMAYDQSRFCQIRPGMCVYADALSDVVELVLVREFDGEPPMIAFSHGGPSTRVRDVSFCDAGLLVRFTVGEGAVVEKEILVEWPPHTPPEPITLELMGIK